jgi:hypothetical protein
MAVMDKWSSDSKYLSENGVRRRDEMMMERARTAHLAHHLSSVALRQWEHALTGILALPAAAALGVAASATYAVALLERAFEVLESGVGEVGRSLASEKRDAPGVEHHAEARA